MTESTVVRLPSNLTLLLYPSEAEQQVEIHRLWDDIALKVFAAQAWCPPASIWTVFRVLQSSRPAEPEPAQSWETVVGEVLARASILQSFFGMGTPLPTTWTCPPSPQALFELRLL